MNIIITGHHIKITPAIENYITSKFHKIERSYPSKPYFYSNAINIVIYNIYLYKKNTE